MALSVSRPLRLPLRLALRQPTRISNRISIPRHYASHAHPTPPQGPSARPSSKLVTSAILFSSFTSLCFAAYIMWPRDSSNTHRAYGALAPNVFTRTIITSSEACGPDTKLITLKLPRSAAYRGSGLDTTPIWSVYVKDDDIQVERAYTPLSASSLKENGQLTFWIKKYDHGEVGRWLHSKNTGDAIEIRGPIMTVSRPWVFKDQEWDHVVMLSGGTGITPFAQLLNHVTSPSTDPSILQKTRFTLLHGSRSPEDLPPPPILDPIIELAQRHPDRFRLRLFVDETSPPLSSLSPNVSALTVGRVGRDDIESVIGISPSPSSGWRSTLWGGSKSLAASPAHSTDKTLFLVCGPDGMIATVAGPPGRNFSQGPVDGILGAMGFNNDSVYKLL